ncbi:hypothetical protein Leryth_024022 [Lithospermum erythrorhizon]|nr:hypothetical protein Leryth_024022 [Lithospermum erythrorhizon]
MQMAVGTEQFEDLKCGLVLKSIGYKSIPVEGVPFEPHKGTVPNVGGRVLNDVKGDFIEFEKGLYVCGWLKRGPTGIIATNHHCAEETVANIIEDINEGVISSSISLPGREGLLQLLANKNVNVVPFSAWEKVDAEEKTRGSLKNKPREKLTTWKELLRVALG